MIALKGIIKERTPQSIYQKISLILSSYKKADDWANQTGAGLLEEKGETFTESFDDYIKRLCPLYETLHPIMRDRAATRPAVTSENGELVGGPKNNWSDDDDNDDDDDNNNHYGDEGNDNDKDNEDETSNPVTKGTLCSKQHTKGKMSKTICKKKEKVEHSLVPQECQSAY